MRNLALSAFLVPGGDVLPTTAARRPHLGQGRDPDRLAYLSTYSSHLPGLSRAEQRALHLVEVEGASYREVGRQLGIGRDDVKELVCNTRRKLYDSVGQVLGALALGLGMGLA